MAEILNQISGNAMTYDSYGKYGEKEKAYQPVTVNVIGNLHKGDSLFMGGVRTNRKFERFVILDSDGVNITDDVLVLDADIEFN